MQIITKKLSDLHPSPYNPRKDLTPEDPEYQKLKKSMLEFDYVDPIIWNRKTNRVVGGHQRLKILEELGKKQVDVSVVDLPDDKEKVLNLALNRIQGEWDYPKLKDLLIELDTGALDMEITGFDEDELKNLIDYEGKQDESISRQRRWQIANPDKEKIAQLSKRYPEFLNILYECPCPCDYSDKENHHFDYRRPFEVIRLCTDCHQKEHVRLRKEDDPGTQTKANKDQKA